MKQDKIKILKEERLSKKAKDEFLKTSKYQTNPFVSKLIAFQKTKKDINIKDLF